MFHKKIVAYEIKKSDQLTVCKCRYEWEGHNKGGIAKSDHSFHLSKTSTEYRVSHIGKTADIWGSVSFSTTASDKDNQNSNSSSIETTISLDRLCVILISGESGDWGDEIRGRKGELTPEVDRQFYPYAVASQKKRPAVFFMAEIEFEQVGQKGLVFRVVPLKLALNSFTSRGRSGKDLVGSFRFSIPSVVTQGGFVHDAVFPPINNVLAGDRIEIANLTSDWISLPGLTGKINELLVERMN